MGWTVGASAVLPGRTLVYALAINGEAGDTHLLRLSETEMRVAMTSTRIVSVSDINARALITARRDAIQQE